MNQQLENQFREFEQKRKTLFANLRSMRVERLYEQPHGRWSAIQNLNHLILSEAGTLMYLKKKIQAVDTLKKTGFSNWFAYQLIWLYTYLPLKIKAPKGIDNPNNEDSLDQIEENWNKLRANWLDFVKNLPESQLQIAIFKHPLVSPRFNVYQTIGFCEAHFLRHQRQIKNTIR